MHVFFLDRLCLLQVHDHRFLRTERLSLLRLEPCVVGEAACERPFRLIAPVASVPRIIRYVGGGPLPTRSLLPTGGR
jgi:hypothetical protein